MAFTSAQRCARAFPFPSAFTCATAYIRAFVRSAENLLARAHIAGVEAKNEEGQPCFKSLAEIVSEEAARREREAKVAPADEFEMISRTVAKHRWTAGAPVYFKQGSLRILADSAACFSVQGRAFFKKKGDK